MHISDLILPLGVLFGVVGELALLALLGAPAPGPAPAPVHDSFANIFADEPVASPVAAEPMPEPAPKYSARALGKARKRLSRGRQRAGAPVLAHV